MAKTLAEATKRPANIGARVPDPPQRPVPAVTVREQPGLAISTVGPAPALWTTSYDSVKQFYRPGTSQQRFPPLPTKANPQLNAAAANVAQTIVNQTIAGQPKSSAPVTQIFLNKQDGTTYTVQLSDLDTLISMTNNAGGVVVLPRSGSGLQFVQTNQGATEGGGATTFSMVNQQGSTLLLTGFVSPNVTLTTQTVSDTNGNSWALLETCSANTELQTLWVAYNVKGGPNTITFNQAFTPPTPPPDQIPFFAVATVDEFAGILTGGLDQVAQGAASASITPTVTPSVAYCSIRASADTSSLTPPAGWTSTPFPQFPWNYPAYDGGGPGGVINGIDEYIQNPTVGTSLIGTATGSFIGDCNVITANFKTSIAPGTIFPYGWFCYIENVSTGIFVVQSLATIDGIIQNITLAPNTGLLLVADGKGGWWTERGAGTGGDVVSSLNGLSGIVDITSSDSSISISEVGNNINLEVAGGGGPSPQSLWTYPQASVTPSSYGAMNPVSGNSMNFTANQIKLFYVNIDKPIQVGNFSFQVNGGDTHHYDWGMYNTSGTLVWNIGPTIFGSTGLITTPLVQGTITIQPGNYWLAFTGDGTGLTFLALTSTQLSNPTFFANSASSTPAWWTSSTTSTGGSLTGLTVVVPSAPTTAANLVLPTNIFGNAPIIPFVCLST